MILFIESDAAYLVLPNTKSRYAEHFYLSTKSNPKLSRQSRYGPIHTECKTIRDVVASAAEAETASTRHHAERKKYIHKDFNSSQSKCACTTTMIHSIVDAAFVTCQ